jgi:HD-GYP domain-containing protein (c-di-GMP phosphodiesterase class II)
MTEADKTPKASSPLAQAREEIKKLSSLLQLSSLINSTLNLELLLKRIMESASAILGAEASSILLIDPKTGDLVFDIATGEKQDQIKQIRVPMGQGIAGWVAQQGQSLLVADVSKDPRFFSKADEATKFVTKSIVAVPLKARGITIGVVEVLNRVGGGEFTQHDVELLESLAHQSAIAVENARLYQNLQDSFVATVRCLAAAIDAKDPYTAGHSSRVTEYAVLLGQELELSLEKVDEIRLSGLLHDVGKIGIPESILSKPGKLTDEEFEAMKRHPEVGANILYPIEPLRHLIPGIQRHHERFDGRGYPGGLKGEEIPLAGRIIGVADAFDAMTSNRVYRPRLSDEVALAELKKGAGMQFDGKVVDAFFSLYQKGKIHTVPAGL